MVDLLKRKTHSRRAVIQLFDANDLVEDHKDVPCTCSLQFMIRHQQLNLHVSMRSNDAFFGLAHDVFCFTMLQEILARELSVELGRYTHVAGSLHLYKDKLPEATQFLNEGWQSTKSPMPPMPRGNPWPAIETLLKVEKEIRETGNPSREIFDELDPYWGDLIRLLRIYRFAKKEDPKSIEQTLKQMSSSVFDAYIEKKTPR
jgi:thymidylate synthase